MLTDKDQGGLLELGEKAYLASNDLRIDLIIQDCVNEESGQLLTLGNFHKVELRIADFFQQEVNKLQQNLLKIINDRKVQELKLITAIATANLEQKITALQHQCEQERNAKKLALEQDLNSTVFTSQEAADNAITAKNAELQSFAISYTQQNQKVFDDYANTIKQGLQKDNHSVLITAEKLFDQHIKVITNIVDSKLISLITELTELVRDNYNIELVAIENYNKTWFATLFKSIDIFANFSINELESKTVSAEHKTFEQFLEETSKKEILVQKNYLYQLTSDVQKNHYLLPTNYLEKLLLLIEDPRCIKLHNNITFILAQSALNGSKLSPEIFKKLENLLDNNQHTEKVVLTLLGSAKNKQHLPDSTLEKLGDIIQNQDIDNVIRIRCLEGLLLVNQHGHIFADSLVKKLIGSLLDPEQDIKQRVISIIKCLFKSGNSNDYNLSTTEIDLLSQVLSTTKVEETRDILAHIVGHYAGRNITTKSAVNTIYELVCAEHFSNQIIFALHNISKNHKYELPIDILEKLASMGANNSTNTNLRLFALESFANLAKYSKISLKYKIIDKLLYDPNPEIKSIAIKLAKYHFETTNQLPQQLVESLASTSFSDELLSQATLEILSLVVEAGELLPKQALDLLGWVLLNHNDQSIRNNALTILKQYETKQAIERDVDDVLIIEKLSKIIILSADDDKKLEDLKEIEQHVIRGGKLTKNCF